MVATNPKTLQCHEQMPRYTARPLYDPFTQAIVGWDFYQSFAVPTVTCIHECGECMSGLAEEWQMGFTISECVADYFNAVYSYGRDLDPLFPREIFDYKISGCYDLTTTYR
jgi:hypothetical protein